MLVNPILASRSPSDPLSRIFAALGCAGQCEIMRTGVISCPHLNFNHEIDRLPTTDRLAMDYPYFDNLGSYGVCDNVEQILARAPEIETSSKHYCISMHWLARAEQSPKGGWRWHKWGEYIGTFEPQCEYFYDEEGIEGVYVFNIFELADGEFSEA